jgi:hypothetical protein
LFHYFLLNDRIVTALAERLAAKKPLQTHPDTL